MCYLHPVHSSGECRLHHQRDLFGLWPCNYSTTRRDLLPQYPVDQCPHEDRDFRGSSRSVHRTFYKQCCTFLDEIPMELQKTRKAVSHKVLEAPLDRVPIIEHLVDDSKDATFSPEMLDTILNDFASLVATSSESEAITSTKLHELLHQSITNAEGDSSFSMVGDVENFGGDFAGLGICFHGDEPDVEMSDGLVHVFQETRDMYDMNDPNIYVVLDEGCNSTCHSKHWAEVTEKKLKNLGYQFPFNDTKGKTFSGLGTGGTSTEGSRTLPFSLNFVDSHCTPVHGVLETHQLSSGKSPLLLSLHAQAHLGLVKDLKNGTKTIDGNQLPVFRCSHTGLMMLAITPNQLGTTGKEFHHTSQRVPKCHRKFRTAFAALSDLPDMPPSTDRLRSPNGCSSSSTAAVEEALNHSLRGLDRSRALIVTSGARWTGRQPSFPGVTVLQVDCRHFHDAESDRSLCWTTPQHYAGTCRDRSHAGAHQSG